MSKIVYIENNDPHSTMTTYFYCSFWQAYAVLQQGHIPFFNWARFKSVLSYDDAAMFQQEPNLYNWYFVQPFLQGNPPADEVRTWNTDTNTGLFPLMGMPLATIRDFYHKNLIFNEATNARGQALVDKYQIDFKKTIGITWRGTDVVLDKRPIMPIETYFPFLDDILEKEPDLRIICTAEETGILDPLLKRYNAVIIEEFEQVQRGTQHNPERFSTRSGYERGLQPTLMVWLFSKCAHYVKNRSSTGAVASWLSDGRIISLGHPENLGFPANTDTAEIEGKLYPLYR